MGKVTLPVWAGMPDLGLAAASPRPPQGIRHLQEEARLISIAEAAASSRYFNSHWSAILLPLCTIGQRVRNV